MMPATARKSRPRGVALLLALSVLMLITMFMSEYFFATGLELRSMTTFREAQQSRMVARSVFRVVQIGLNMDEVEFFNGYRQVAKLLEGGIAVPFDDALLIALNVAPQDHLYNLNQIHSLQPGKDLDVGRRELFKNALNDLNVPGLLPGSEPELLAPGIIDGFYAALIDWIDKDDEQYIEIPGVSGAEAGAYFAVKPEFTVKNGMLDRLDEIRLVRGVREGRVLWGEWQRRFTVLPKGTPKPNYFMNEKINVNIASRQEISDFLAKREVVDPVIFQNIATQKIQEGINKYSERAEEIAERFVPEEGEERKAFSEKELGDELKNMGFSDKYGIDHLFSTINRYYRVSLVTEVGRVQTRLEALLSVTRDPNTRTGQNSEVIWVSVQ